VLHEVHDEPWQVLQFGVEQVEEVEGCVQEPEDNVYDEAQVVQYVWDTQVRQLFGQAKQVFILIKYPALHDTQTPFWQFLQLLGQVTQFPPVKKYPSLQVQQVC